MQSRSQFQQNKTRTAADVDSSLRCGCGNLLARIVAEGVEIKCRRCKRHVVVPVDTKGTVRINM
jgi:phage FluMu protein Com